MIMNERKENIAENILRKLIAFVVVLSLAIPLMAPGVFAASEVSISGGNDVKGGETFTLAVTFSGGDVGRVDAQMLYDTDALTYISGGTSSGDTGYIQLKSAGTEGAIVFNLKFQALAEGSTELQVTTNEMYDLDEMPMETPMTFTTINILGNADEEEIVTEPPDEEEPEEPSSLVGVDEKEEGSEAEAEQKIPLDLDNIDIVKVSIIVAVILFLLIVIITSLATRKKRKNNKMIRERVNALNNERDDYDSESQRIGRSGKPLDYEPKWEITDDDYKDIDKW